MKFEFKHFKDLSIYELYEILHLRQEIFVVEQQSIYQDCDNYDQVSFHLFLRNEKGKIVSYLRLIPPEEKFHEAAIGRVVVHKSARGEGLGFKLMKEGIKNCNALFQNTSIKISAQAHLQIFYGSLGFVTTSDEYDEDGIPHVEMVLE